MRKLLLQLDADRLASAFDRIVAYDAGADEVLSYSSVTEEDVRGLVHGAIFTRGPKDLRNTAAFVGGSSLATAEGLLKAATQSFFGPFRVSILFDPGGCNTTAAAAVVKLVGAVGGDVRGRRALVLAGTGPVGRRAAGLLLRLGAEVRITSRDDAHGASAAAEVGARFKGPVEHATVRGPSEVKDALAWAEILLAAGPAGVALVPRGGWSGQKALRAIADVNAVPPLGIEGVEAADNGDVREGVAVFGALGIGGLKMKAHKAAVARLFERSDLVLDAEGIYDLAAAL
ncbi:MAG: NAD(P)-dependent methylenetetrahydromethanopterin dehydrogenase [Vicinamibacteria bacterium]